MALLNYYGNYAPVIGDGGLVFPGAGGGGGGITSGAGAPAATAPTGDEGWYYDTTNGVVYLWNTSTDTWDRVIG